MLTQSLNGTWLFRQADSPDWLPAQVPGGVFTDLMAAGRIPDPFVEMNEQDVQWVADQDWEYQCVFDAAPELLAEDQVELVCAGLDTLAELVLNGSSLGRTENMFRTYRWEVKSLLRSDENTLSIVFRSPVAYINARQEERPLPALMNAGMAHLRKAQSHFGWDWGPRLPVSGVWRDIVLEGHSTARLDEVQVRQEHAGGVVTLAVSAACKRWRAGDLALSIILTAPQGPVTRMRCPVKGGWASLKMTVKDPQLWWPNGLGEQPLYLVEAALLSGERELDRRVLQVGLRSLELRQAVDQWGQGFTFVVNGLPVFAKGANWIPADSFPARVSTERLEMLVRSAAAANMNMLRVWGGGYYEDERFYDLCDLYGILVWQDFMFACAAYPLDEPAFQENVHAEVIENVRRLRHRACLALWCGNNEVEMMWGLWRQNTSLTQSCQSFFHQLLPAWVKAEDPERPYWPSSPSSGNFMKDTNGDVRGDTHLWQVWHGQRPFSFYRTRLARFASEFGLESLPAPDSLEGVIQPGEMSLDSAAMKHHQRSLGGNDKLIYYLTERFRLPRDFEDWAYLTQIQQAEAVRTGVEHWRRNFPRCSGALYWQLNDCWPAVSWSSIESNGRWKALQYAARRFFAPLALSLEETGSQVKVYAANDAPDPWRGELRWSLETLDGEALQTGQAAVTAAPLSATRLAVLGFKQELAGEHRRTCVFVAELCQDGLCLARQVAAFALEKDMLLPDSGLAAQVEVEGTQLVIHASARQLARFVAISLDGVDVIFSDNYFDLPAGRTQRVTCPLPAGWSLERARAALRLRSLADVVPGGTPLSDRLARARIAATPVNLGMRILFGLVK